MCMEMGISWTCLRYCLFRCWACVDKCPYLPELSTLQSFLFFAYKGPLLARLSFAVCGPGRFSHPPKDRTPWVAAGIDWLPTIGEHEKQSQHWYLYRRRTCLCIFKPLWVSVTLLERCHGEIPTKSTGILALGLHSSGQWVDERKCQGHGFVLEAFSLGPLTFWRSFLLL